MTLERGVLFMEDGTEVSDVSIELLIAAPALLKALKKAVTLIDEGNAETARTSRHQDIWDLIHSATYHPKAKETT
jgi:hypothetical protein